MASPQVEAILLEQLRATKTEQTYKKYAIRPGVAALMNAIIPGAGMIYSGYRLAGLLWLFINIPVGILAVFFPVLLVLIIALNAFIGFQCAEKENTRIMARCKEAVNEKYPSVWDEGSLGS